MDVQVNVVDRSIQLTDEPGFGIHLSAAAIDRYRV